MKRGKNRRRHYRLRAAVNLLLCAVCLFAVWADDGYPLPGMEQAFRRLERMEQLPQSQLVLRTPEDGMLMSTTGEVLQLGNRWYVGLTRDAVTQAHMADTSARSSANIWAYPRREEGATLVPLASGANLNWNRWGTGIRWEAAPDEGQRDWGLSMLLVDAPADTARVEVWIQELDGYVSLPPLRWHGRGWELSEGVWLLGLQPEKNYAAHSFPGWHWSIPYELRLYDGADNLIYERSGTFSDDL